MTRAATVALAIKIAKDLQEDKLTMGNYETWASTMRAVLEDVVCGEEEHEQDVWLTVIRAEEQKDPAPAGNAPNAKKKAYKQGASFAKQLIERTVDAANKSQIRTLAPRDAWLRLQQIHRSAAPVNLDNIEHKMEKLSISDFRKQAKNDEEQAVMLYTAAMADLRERYLAAGGTMPETALFYKIVRNLPKEYKNYKDQLNTKDSSDLNYTYLSNFLVKAAIAVDMERRLHRQEEHKSSEENLALITKNSQRNTQGKAQLCNNYLQDGSCRFAGKCRFLHLSAEDIERFYKYATSKNKIKHTTLLTMNTDDGEEDVDYADTPGLVL